MTKAPPNSIHPKSRADWRKWLAENHTRPEGVWLISYKKATGKPRFDYDEAVEAQHQYLAVFDEHGNKVEEFKLVGAYYTGAF